MKSSSIGLVGPRVRVHRVSLRILRRSFLLWAALLPGLLAVPSQAAERVYHVDWRGDSAITVGAAVLGAVPYLFDDRILRFRCPCPPSEVNGFDRGAIGKNSRFAVVTSDLVSTGSILAAVLIDGLQTEWQAPFADDMLVLAEVLAVNSAFNSVVKHSVQRPIPLSYTTLDPSVLTSGEGYRSFYSGHTSTACAALGFLAFTTAQRHSGVTWPWLALAGGGLAAGLLRVEAGRHFYTDILVGAAAGATVGIFVPWVHTRRETAAWVPVPVPLPGGALITLSAIL